MAELQAVRPKRTIRAYFIEAREIKLSSTGRIYGSKPVPVIDDAKSCKAGGDHIRDKRSVPGRMPRYPQVWPPETLPLVLAYGDSALLSILGEIGV